MTNGADPDQLVQKPTDLDLHFLLRQGTLCSAREGLISLSTIRKEEIKKYVTTESIDRKHRMPSALF